MNDDERYMKRAIELGWRGIGRNSPNPLVGCVIVRDGEIVGEAFHLFAEIDHAEKIALEIAGEKASGATAYVSLEPCCHTGRTPPCCEALIKAGIARVVYGLKDPDSRVNGTGHKILADAGIEVLGGVLENEVREQNKFFVTANEKDRPHVLLKWAMTLDGKIATRSGASKWISNEKSRNVVHHLRNIYDAILVGHTTVLTDDPKLDCRVDLNAPLPPEIFPAVPEDVRHPLRIIVDALGATLTSDHRIFDDPGNALIAIAPESVWEDYRARDSIDSTKTELLECPLKAGHIDLAHLLKTLRERGIQSLLVEGGSGIHAAFLEAGLVDEMAIFIAPKFFAGDSAPSPVSGTGVESVSDAWHLDDLKHIRLDNDLMILGKIADVTEQSDREGDE